MTQIIEETLKSCKTCSKTTRHMRNNSKSSGFAILIHVILTLITVGLWLIPLVVYKFMLVKVGGWTCCECGH